MKGFFAVLALAAIAFASFGLGQSSVIEQTDGCPGGQCQRTIPFSATTAPVFDAPPAVSAGGPVVSVDSVVAPVVPNITVVVPDAVPKEGGLDLTPEQKEALKSLLSQALTLVVGLFLGRGTTGPLFSKLLTALLGHLQTPPEKAASTRKRLLRK